MLFCSHQSCNREREIISESSIFKQVRLFSLSFLAAYCEQSVISYRTLTNIMCIYRSLKSFLRGLYPHFLVSTRAVWTKAYTVHANYRQLTCRSLVLVEFYVWTKRSRSGHRWKRQRRIKCRFSRSSPPCLKMLRVSAPDVKGTSVSTLQHVTPPMFTLSPTAQTRWSIETSLLVLLTSSGYNEGQRREKKIRLRGDNWFLFFFNRTLRGYINLASLKLIFKRHKVF